MAAVGVILWGGDGMRSRSVPLRRTANHGLFVLPHLFDSGKFSFCHLNLGKDLCGLPRLHCSNLFLVLNFLSHLLTAFHSFFTQFQYRSALHPDFNSIQVAVEMSSSSQSSSLNVSWPGQEYVICNHGVHAEIGTSRTDTNPER
ncbi:hypothetical protein AAHA92_07070 [Salvia divinorum]|uniref:Uncharacterized protein n=1 Tax=Salvia divinorum TaxID=28513 RepID=A0ABD1I7R5_SALDI